MSNTPAYSPKVALSAKDNPTPESLGPPEAAAYIAALSGELIGIARQNGLDTLAYLLDMARLEATNAAGEAKDPSTGSVK